MESSDRLRHTDLVVVENTFNRPRFDPGKIYFLNTQKLGKKSLLVRGRDRCSGGGGRAGAGGLGQGSAARVDSGRWGLFVRYIARIDPAGSWGGAVRAHPLPFPSP